MKKYLMNIRFNKLIYILLLINFNLILIVNFNIKDVLAINNKVNDKYELILSKLEDTMTPNKQINLEDNEVRSIIDNKVSKASEYWKSMNKGSEVLSLWSDINNKSNSSSITNSFNRLFQMTLAYKLKGSSLKDNEELLNDIIYGLEYMIENEYNGKQYYGNWWDWEIGAPQGLNNILILLRDKLKSNYIKKCTDIIYSYVLKPDKYINGKQESFGANRTDICKVYIYSALLIKDNEKINQGVESLDILFNYTDDSRFNAYKKNDGYYRDGSFIDHDIIPYAGSYGVVFIEGIGELAYILYGSEWEISNDKIMILYNVLLKSFEPFIFKGYIMHMVSGRSISRANQKEYGYKLMRAIVEYYIEILPQKESDKLKSIILSWKKSNEEIDLTNKISNLNFVIKSKKLTDTIIENNKDEVKTNIFPNMDRVVHRGKNFTFGISMYSSRIGNYESINGENLKGYHTSDGMTYLYTNDMKYYYNDFWPTVDFKKLPGTTVDKRNIFLMDDNLKEGIGQKAISPRDWVGGSTLGDYGVAGMYLDNKRYDKSKDIGMDLEAKKSYFMFGDEIVALGTGINSTLDNGVETIIENKPIDKSINNIYINGENIGNDEKEVKINKSKTIYIEGNSIEESIGYYFPEEQKLDLTIQNRQGAWYDINRNQSKDIKNNRFCTVIKNHGINPENESYSYVILPNISKESIEIYDSEKNIYILENNEYVQAVRENNDGVISANFWEDKWTEIKAAGIKVNCKASITLQNKDGVLRIAVSDPTMKNSGKVIIELNDIITGIKSKDSRIDVVYDNKRTILTVDVKDTFGSSIIAEFSTRKIQEKPLVKESTFFSNDNILSLIGILCIIVGTIIYKGKRII